MDAFLARQPILTREQAVLGYELLFRNGSDNFFRPTDGDLATASLISDAVNLHSIEKLTEGRLSFINFTRKALLSALYTLLPHATTVVEVLESLDVDDELLAACDLLKKRGYQLALDDYVLESRFDSLLSRIDVLKVEFPALTETQHQDVIESSRRYGFKLLAEKVEDPAQFEFARDLGYDYFQGYFFCRPQMVKTRRLPGSHVNSLRLLTLANQRDFDLDQAETLIRSDLSLSYNLLRYINSPMFRRDSKVQSVRHAITTLGQKPLSKWVSVTAMQQLSSGKPPELLNTCLIRGYFCERIGRLALSRELVSECFTVGMFSLLDAMLDKPMKEVTQELSLSDAATRALLGESSVFLNMLQLTSAIEYGDWASVGQLAPQLGVSEADVTTLYCESVECAASVRSETTAV